MSDLHLRATERAFRALGGAAAEAALLRERLRFGVLTWDRVRQGAWAGHPTCRELLAEHGLQPIPPLDCARLGSDLHETRRWSRTGKHLGRRVVVGAAADGLEAALRVGVGRNERRGCERALGLLCGWVADIHERQGLRPRLVAALAELRQARLAQRRPSWTALVALLEGATVEDRTFVPRGAEAIALAMTIAGTESARVQATVGQALARGALDLDRR